VGAAEALGGAPHDNVEHALWIRVQLVVPDPQNGPPLLSKESIPPNIPLALRMLAPVQLDNELRLATREIGDVRSDRQLPREFGPQP
jgi:hypothetical protein